jgi:hypothetical protein
MPPRQNPLKLNPLQLKTLTLLQELARTPEVAMPDGEGGVAIAFLPRPHGNHFHVGSKVVMTADASGLANPAVWVALARKGLVRPGYPDALALTAEGVAYETGIADQILHGADH